MNFKACTFERLVLIFGFGRGAQVGKTSLLEVNLYGASVDVGCIIFIRPKAALFYVHWELSELVFVRACVRQKGAVFKML